MFRKIILIIVTNIKKTIGLYHLIQLPSLAKHVANTLVGYNLQI